MTRLVDFQKDEDRNGVHEGRVELEVGVIGTDMVATRHDAFHDQGQAHGVVHSKVLRNPVLFPMFLT